MSRPQLSSIHLPLVGLAQSLSLIIYAFAILPTAAAFTTTTSTSRASWSAINQVVKPLYMADADDPEASADISHLASTKPFGINVAFHINPSRRDEFLDVLTGTTLEPALQFVVGQDVDDENKFYIHQEYESRTDNPNIKTTYFDEVVPFLETGAFATFPIANEFDLHHHGHSEKVTNAKGSICLNVELCIKPEVRDRFLDVIRNNKAGSDNEPLCLQYSWGEDIYDPNKFHFHEQYVGEEGLAAHFEGDHFKVWEEFAESNPFLRPPRVEKFTLL